MSDFRARYHASEAVWAILAATVPDVSADATGPVVRVLSRSASRRPRHPGPVITAAVARTPTTPSA